MSSFKPNGESSRQPQMGQRVSQAAMELATQPRRRVTASASDVGPQATARAEYDAFINAPVALGDDAHTFASFGREALREPACTQGGERAVYRMAALARHLDPTARMEIAWTRAQRQDAQQIQAQDAPEKSPPSSPHHVAAEEAPAAHGPETSLNQRQHQQAEAARPESSDGSTLCPDDARSAAGSEDSEPAFIRPSPHAEAAAQEAEPEAVPHEAPQAQAESAVRPETSEREAERLTSDEHAPVHAQAEPEPQADAQVRTQDPEGNPITINGQPDARPISQEQLVAEVKGIYAGLVMVEAKCLEVDANPVDNLSNEQYQARTAMHRTLMDYHHDFMLASQDPMASAQLKRLSPKYAMPARWWKHSVQTYLEVLLHRLPVSLEHMIRFIYEAMSMTMLFLETVGNHNQNLKETYSECMGDLCRYRMAIEDDSVHDREHFTEQAKYWYQYSQDLQADAGRLSHHMGTLARGDAVKQLALFGASLTAGKRFDSAERSLLATIFSPELDEECERRNLFGELPGAGDRAPPVQRAGDAFVSVHRALDAGRADSATFDADLQHFYATLPQEMFKRGRGYKEQGVDIALANIAAVMDFGRATGFLQQRVAPNLDDNNPVPVALRPTSRDVKAQEIAMKTLDIALLKVADPNAAPQVHASLAFIRQTLSVPDATTLTFQRMPWAHLMTYLNGLVRAYKGANIVERSFPTSNGRPLPEDFHLRGLSWVSTGDAEAGERDYFPQSWFTEANCRDDERTFERDGTQEQRAERILWLGRQIAEHEDALLGYDGTTGQFHLKRPVPARF